MPATKTITYAKLSAAAAYDLATCHGAGHVEAVNALIRAERHGADMAGRCVIQHEGYAPGATQFGAESALYRVTF
jgi:hypothetical protein